MVNFTPIGATNSAPEVTSPKAKEKAVGQDAFLQLLVAQIRNQNPLDPANGVEFLTQLAQFSQLEQSVGIREELSLLRTQVNDIVAAMPDTKADGAGGSTDKNTTGESNV